MNLTQQISKVKESAEKMNAAETEVIGTASCFDVVRQGDLYLVCLPALPNAVMSYKGRQLAPGTTQGSRHIIAGDCTIITPSGAEIADLVNKALPNAGVQPELVGPVIQCRGDCTVTHPEHGNKVLPDDSVWAVVYQRAYGEDVRRVQD